MNELRIFENPEFGQVRTATDDQGNPLFCGSDVARALGYQKPHNAVAAHCKCITLKQGIIDLIIRSKLPEAEKFERWVMEEVLPSIRKHGGCLRKEHA